MVTIYDLLLVSILGICGSDASVAFYHHGGRHREGHRRASRLVGEEMEEATNSNRKKRAFAPECGLIWLNCCVLLDILLLGTGTVYVHFSVPSKRLMSLSIAEQPFGDDAGLQGEQTN